LSPPRTDRAFVAPPAVHVVASADGFRPDQEHLFATQGLLVETETPARFVIDFEADSTRATAAIARPT
jgi:hypothetical protein